MRQTMARSNHLMTDIRAGLAAIPPDVSHVVGNPPHLQEILTPPGHALALDPESPIVVGARGAGKSFWASVIADSETLAGVAPFYPRLRLADVAVRPGFVDQPIGISVSRDTLDELAIDEKSTRALWLVLAIRAAEDVLNESTCDSLESGMDIYKRSESRERRLRELDEKLRKSGIRLVVLFDALDRLSGDWSNLRIRTTTLLETLLTMRAFRSIKFKLFVRPEQLESVPSNFTDLSKLKAGSFDLRWTATDLYALAYTWLAGHSDSSVAFASLLEHFRVPSPTVRDGKISLAEHVLRDPEIQSKIFVSIAGPYMGADKRRGRTYPWLPKHLADTRGRVTPRSFLTALGSAARFEKLPQPRYALSIEGIKHGVSEASVLRVDQLKDEYKWIELALQPLAGQEVPCQQDQIFDRWLEADTIQEIRRQSRREGYLAPFQMETVDDDPNYALLRSLMEIGVVEKRPDGRANIPDLFRIAALMLRRGGPRLNRVPI
ncbi:hypothetical protein [Methylobacterium tarhaniae]|uniref:hypothetical protein n=1 Tax=Methylobacterium tarhaniae TaxID=1187852 RepID=UPI0012EE6F3D|nr:hypothetical protein [Methylobacterium tarhaniae]